MSDKKIPMVSDASYKHDGKWLRRNDPFQCTELEADDLEALHFAHRKPAEKLPEKPVEKKAPAQNKTLESAPLKDDDEDETKADRTYQRRDMTAKS